MIGRAGVVTESWNRSDTNSLDLDHSNSGEDGGKKRGEEEGGGVTLSS
jgi:hypothetical protein